MSQDLLDELEAINSIFGDGTIVQCDSPEGEVRILTLPQHNIALRLSFPSDYPDQPPRIIGTETTGDLSRKGQGIHTLNHARETLRKTFSPGSVCLFDMLQELENVTRAQTQVADQPDQPNQSDLPDGPMHKDSHTAVFQTPISSSLEQSHTISTPVWTLSERITFKKSVFLARACSVSSPFEAHAALNELTMNDKRVAKATHNINAYRIRSPPVAGTNDGLRQITYQDSDDAGETAAGTRLLHLLQGMDVWDVFVVVSRWYGGVQLGPDRFRIISQTAREAVSNGGWLKGGGRDERKMEKR